MPDAPRAVAPAGRLLFGAVPVSVPDPDRSWKPVNPATAPEMSAVAWFFARRVHRETGVPVGILFAAVGGTKIETWVDFATAATDPAAGEAAGRIRDGAEPVQAMSSPTVMYNGRQRLPSRGTAYCLRRRRFRNRFTSVTTGSIRRLAIFTMEKGCPHRPSARTCEPPLSEHANRHSDAALCHANRHGHASL